MYTSDIKVISTQKNTNLPETTKTITSSDLNTSNINDTTKVISFNSPKLSKKNIKSITFEDYNLNETTPQKIETISTKDTILEEISETTPKVTFDNINNNSIKTITFEDSDTQYEPQLSILNSDTIKSFSFYNSKKEISYLNSVSEILKLKKNSCIKYKHKSKKKVKWAIIHDIVINNNHVTLLLKKGKFSWIHQINLKYYSYFITPS